jgi:hypothetical protein
VLESFKKYSQLSEIFVTKVYKQFEDWFFEMEGVGSRSERCYDDYDTLKTIEPFANLRRWMEAAFLAGRMENQYILEIEEDGTGDQYITFPPELLAQHGWQDGTTVEWIDNGDGSWTLKGKT